MFQNRVFFVALLSLAALLGATLGKMHAGCSDVNCEPFGTDNDYFDGFEFFKAPSSASSKYVNLHNGGSGLGTCTEDTVAGVFKYEDGLAECAPPPGHFARAGGLMNFRALANVSACTSCM